MSLLLGERVRAKTTFPPTLSYFISPPGLPGSPLTPALSLEGEGEVGCLSWDRRVKHTRETV